MKVPDIYPIQRMYGGLALLGDAFLSLNRLQLGVLATSYTLRRYRQAEFHVSLCHVCVKMHAVRVAKRSCDILARCTYRVLAGHVEVGPCIHRRHHRF